MRTTKGLYIHIPFCASKCAYCDFYSVSKDTNMMELYVDSLVEEIKKSSQFHSNDTIDTIYIGGGTPSVLPLYLLDKIVDAINKYYNLDLQEFTMEANPSSNFDPADIKAFGIDRLSLGIQTLNNRLLKLIGRLHDSKTAIETLNRCAGVFNKISADLMIGLPTQTMDDVSESVQTVSNLVNHVSVYMLKLSDNVPMAVNVRKGLYDLPDDDTFADFYDRTYEILKENGFQRYEISNFSIAGFESKHNLKYWNRDDYIGLGAAAHGFVNEVRYVNPSDIHSYIAGNNYGNGLSEKTKISTKDAIFEKIMLALRLPEGLDINSFNNEFNLDFCSKYNKIINKLHGILKVQDGRAYILEDKMLLESAVAREFLI
ncbi:MAG: radical SAM family heme chaperone HemW [Clostridia bacterium]|nr:radical SAM family heme chaperone HemW [Clostridia bacterium]